MQRQEIQENKLEQIEQGLKKLEKKLIERGIYPRTVHKISRSTTLAINGSGPVFTVHDFSRGFGKDAANTVLAYGAYVIPFLTAVGLFDGILELQGIKRGKKTQESVRAVFELINSFSLFAHAMIGFWDFIQSHLDDNANEKIVDKSGLIFGLIVGLSGTIALTNFGYTIHRIRTDNQTIESKLGRAVEKTSHAISLGAASRELMFYINENSSYAAQFAKSLIGMIVTIGYAIISANISEELGEKVEKIIPSLLDNAIAIVSAVAFGGYLDALNKQERNTEAQFLILMYTILLSIPLITRMSIAANHSHLLPEENISQDDYTLRDIQIFDSKENPNDWTSEELGTWSKLSKIIGTKTPQIEELKEKTGEVLLQLDDADDEIALKNDKEPAPTQEKIDDSVSGVDASIEEVTTLITRHDDLTERQGKILSELSDLNKRADVLIKKREIAERQGEILSKLSAMEKRLGAAEKAAQQFGLFGATQPEAGIEDKRLGLTK